MDATHRLFRRWQIIQTLAILFAVAVVMASAAVPAVAEDGDALANKVTIRRTEYGVPHIEAETLEAVAFGFGYCQAEDHLINIMRGMLVLAANWRWRLGPTSRSRATARTWRRISARGSTAFTPGLSKTITGWIPTTARW